MLVLKHTKNCFKKNEINESYCNEKYQSKKKARSYCDFKKKHFFKKKKVKKVINVVVIIFLQTLKLILKLMKRVCFFFKLFF